MKKIALLLLSCAFCALLALPAIAQDDPARQGEDLQAFRQIAGKFKDWRSLSPEDRITRSEEIVTLLSDFLKKYPESKYASRALSTRTQLRVRFLKQVKQAIDELTELVKSAKKGSTIRNLAVYSLANTLAQKGMKEKATALIKGFVKEDPNNPWVKRLKGLLFQLNVVGSVPPEFSGNDYLSGKAVSLKGYRGKIVLLDFWATWCGPCIVELPNVLNIYKKWSAKGFDIIGISFDNARTIGGLKDFCQEKGMAWAQLADGKGWQNAIGQEYGITSIPRMYLLDEKGVVRHANLWGPALAKAVDAMMEGYLKRKEKGGVEKKEEKKEEKKRVEYR